MLRLSAFADEIGPELGEQIRVCRANGVSHFELRGINGINVMDFSPALQAEIRSRLSDSGMGVISIASPIGKLAIDQPWEAHFERYKRAVELAQFFAAPFIRVFSYYPAGGEGKGPADPHRNEILDRFRQKVLCLAASSITLLHENEKGTFGDIGRRCLELMQGVDSPKLRCAFDFANFVQVGDRPRDDWPSLKPYTAHIHIKDAMFPDGRVVPAGEGDGDIPFILEDAFRNGYRGFLSLEPHLKVAGHSHGETGPALFTVAADALKKVCQQVGVPLASA